MSRCGKHRNPISPDGKDARVKRVNAPAVAIAPNKAILVENFGRDQDLKNLLRNLLPKDFTGEGDDVPKVLEERILSMEDYFSLALYNSIAQGLMSSPSWMDHPSFSGSCIAKP